MTSSVGFTGARSATSGSARRSVTFDGNADGVISPTFVSVAARFHCYLIVLGSRGLGGMESFMLGSVSERVTHHAHCPVLIVK